MKWNKNIIIPALQEAFIKDLDIIFSKEPDALNNRR